MSLLSNSLIIASWPGFKSDNFIINFVEYKANFTELHLLTNFEIMPQARSKVKFFFLTSNQGLKNRKDLKRFLISIFNKEKKKLEAINYIFTDDKNLLKINKQYLNHNFLTDIITFDLSDKGQPITAEVYISLKRVKQNASIHQTTFKQELHRVIFHGALHLCGYNDKTDRQRNQMRKKENSYITDYFG